MLLVAGLSLSEAKLKSEMTGRSATGKVAGCNRKIVNCREYFVVVGVLTKYY